MRNIVVIGSDHINTLGLIRSLGEAGESPAAVIACDEGRCWTAGSRYLKSFKVCRFDSSEMLRALLDFRVDGQKSFLIPAGDPFSKLIDNNREQLGEYYILPGADESVGGLSQIMNKKPMCEAAQKIGGFRLPYTLYYRIPESGDIISIPEIEECENYYPLIIRNGESAPNADGDIYIVRDRDEFSAALEKKRGLILIIQQFIVKDEEIGVQGVGFGKNKEPVVAGFIHKVRTSAGGSMGSTTYARIAPAENRDVAEAVKKFIQGVGYDGIYDIELLRKGDEYYFVECNFRNGAYGYAFTRAGANLPLIWVNRGGEASVREMTLMNETADLKHIGKSVSAFGWLSQFMKADIHLTCNRKDMKPFIERLLSK